MLKPIAKLAPGIVGFAAKGEVTADDYHDTLIPAVNAALKGHKKIRFLYHLGPGFSGFSIGAIWQDARFGIGKLKAFEKIAVVTDVEWTRHGVSAFQFMMPMPVQVFHNRQIAAAKNWLKA